MKFLIVAHPDDEILWFNPNYFDHIFIIFNDRKDKEYMGSARHAVMNEHPCKQKISLMNFDEPGYWKDKTKKLAYKEAKTAILNALRKILLSHKITCIFTHNHVGEYGHSDHVLVNKCVELVFRKKHPIWAPDINLTQHENKRITSTKCSLKTNFLDYQLIKELYISHKAWTWNPNYIPNETQEYYCMNEGVL
ncbi:MAG: hypothetical protein Q8L78_05295 [Coxiellaceae bacterium]|nr:hypothetical protein [Coxiellaceae bacterium]